MESYAESGPKYPHYGHAEFARQNVPAQFRTPVLCAFIKIDTKIYYNGIYPLLIIAHHHFKDSPFVLRYAFTSRVDQFVCLPRISFNALLMRFPFLLFCQCVSSLSHACQ